MSPIASMNASVRLRKPLGFTLIELLVVVAVLGLLLSLLLPSLRVARENGYSAKCKHRLREMHTMLNSSRSPGDMRLPEATNWLNHVSAMGGGGLVNCPAHDNTDDGPVTGIGDIVIYQSHHPNRPSHQDLHYSLQAIVEEGMCQDEDDDTYFQCHFKWLEAGQKLKIMVGRKDNPCGICIITFQGLHMMIESSNDGIANQSGSYHYVMKGGQEILELCGKELKTVDPRSPVIVGTTPISYGMNDEVHRIGADPGQILLLDYEYIRAIPETDEPEMVAYRHRGRANAVHIDGHVGHYWPHELDFSEGHWWHDPADAPAP
jgi:prepilin-type N-terminal cleavage/methylation domain-containing protein/prepilin-type processing-associated H-X9-DG protein